LAKLIDLFNKKKSAPIQNSENPITDESIIKGYAKTAYQKSPYYYPGTEQILSIKPNEIADQYSGKLNYTLTRAKEITKWLLSSKGLMFGLNQQILQTLNPSLETKIYNPVSIFSNTIPFVGFHERRHMTLSSLFGIPLPFNVPEQYSDYIRIDGSRNIHQSPLTNMEFINNSKYSQDFAKSSTEFMSKSEVWKKINPNRYKFPIGADGAGLPISNRVTPKEEMNINIGLAKNAIKYTSSTAINPPLDGQITIKKSGGSAYLQSVLTSVPFVGTVLSYFGYGSQQISDSNKIKYFNTYNLSYPYSINNGKTIRIITNNNNVIEYNFMDNKSPLTDLLTNINKISDGNSDQVNLSKGITFAKTSDIQAITKLKNKINPQTGVIEEYRMSYGDINVIRKGQNLNYSERVIDRKVYEVKGLGLGKKDSINEIKYGDDYSKDADGVIDIIPFKFYHVNTGKTIIFRATLNSMSDSINPEWNSKKYIGRADKLYVYTGAERSFAFSFIIMITSPSEMKSVYDKVNALIGLCYPVYKNLQSVGKYMEAPFIKLTIGDLFDNVHGILHGNININYSDDVSWEIRDNQPAIDGYYNSDIKMAKVPRYMTISTTFIPFSLNAEPIGSNSDFYSVINKLE